jgi:hypothetical protein
MTIRGVGAVTALALTSVIGDIPWSYLGSVDRFGLSG